MDYNISGILYEIFAKYVILLALGAFLLILGIREWKKIKKSKEEIFKKPKKALIELIFGAFATLFSLGALLGLIYTSITPSVLTNDGYFVRENRTQVGEVLPFKTKYSFTSTTSDEIKTFYLDTFSKKKICPDGFLENEYYRVYYEKNTKIILKIEEIDND